MENHHIFEDVETKLIYIYMYTHIYMGVWGIFVARKRISLSEGLTSINMKRFRKTGSGY